MSATIDDIAVGLGPLWVIDQRLTYHSVEGSGRVLDGIHYGREGVTEAEGEKDLPYVKPLSYLQNDEIASGATVLGNSGERQVSRLTLIVSANRRYGLMRRDPTAAITEPDYDGVGALEWVMRVCDAILRVTDGTDLADDKLEGTLARPVTLTVEEAPVNEFSWTFLVQVEYQIASICPGARSVAP